MHMWRSTETIYVLCSNALTSIASKVNDICIDGHQLLFVKAANSVTKNLSYSLMSGGTGRILCMELDSPTPRRNQVMNCNALPDQANSVDESGLKVVIDINRDGGDHQQHVKANSSFFHSVINMTGVLIGLGQLSTPYAVQNGGWASMFLLIGFGISCAYTSYLLGKCLQKNEKWKNYLDIAQYAFGKKGKHIVSVFMYLEIFMALISFTISLSDNIGTIFATEHITIPGVHLSTTQLLTVIAVLVALPTLWLKDLSSISFLSTVGIFMSLLIFITVGCTAAFGGIKLDKHIPVFQLHNIPEISGLYIFSFASHFILPNIYRSMKDPSQYNKVSIVSFSIVIGLYTSLGFMGAKLFGPEVNPQITLSMPPHLIITKIALWATVLTPMTKYALQLLPVAVQLEPYLPCSTNPKMRLFIRGCLGSFFLLVILVFALSVPFFEHVLGLTGSLVSISISLTFPCAFYIKIFWSQLSKPVVIINVILITFGSFLGVLGTISSSKSLVISLQKANS